MTEKDWMDFPCEGGITIDTKSAKSSLEEIAISVSGLHPMASVNWAGNAYRLREVSILIASMETEIDQLRTAAETIRKIVHTPSGTQRPMDHFPRDFDQIRTILKPLLGK